jgi:hypothetical protein
MADLDFTGKERIDVAISEQGASAVIRKMHVVAAAMQKLDPGVAMSLRGEALRLGEHMESVVSGAAVVALQEAVMKTPVDTGLLRSNWSCKINKSRPQSHPTTEVDLDGLRTIEEGTAVIKNTERQPGDIIWLSNSAHHAVACEHGYSQKAPQGMTRFAVMAAEKYVHNQRILKRGKL